MCWLLTAFTTAVPWERPPRVPCWAVTTRCPPGGGLSQGGGEAGPCCKKQPPHLKAQSHLSLSISLSLWLLPVLTQGSKSQGPRTAPPSCRKLWKVPGEAPCWQPAVNPLDQTLGPPSALVSPSPKEPASAGPTGPPTLPALTPPPLPPPALAPPQPGQQRALREPHTRSVALLCLCEGGCGSVGVTAASEQVTLPAARPCPHRPCPLCRSGAGREQAPRSLGPARPSMGGKWGDMQ